jgi:hypothetical protein
MTTVRAPDHYDCDNFDVIDPDGHRRAFGRARTPVPDPGLGNDRGRR